jgi:hypothetical protein
MNQQDILRTVIKLTENFPVIIFKLLNMLQVEILKSIEILINILFAEKNYNKLLENKMKKPITKSLIK